MSALGKMVWPVETAGRKTGNNGNRGIDAGRLERPTGGARKNGNSEARRVPMPLTEEDQCEPLADCIPIGGSPRNCPSRYGICTSRATELPSFLAGIIGALITLSVREAVLRDSIAGLERRRSGLCQYPD
jgi:hypothetical protein